MGPKGGQGAATVDQGPDGLPDASPDPLFSVSEEGTIVSWNWGAEVVYGHARDAAIGQSYLGLCVPEAQRPETQAAMEEASLTGSANLESVRRSKDGHPVHVQVTYRRLDTAPPAVAVHERDITEAKRLEAELFDRLWAIEEARARFRGVLEASTHHAILFCDKDGVVRTWNAGAMEIWKCEGARAEGRPVTEFFSTAAPGGLAFADAMTSLKVQSRFEGELVARRDDGQPVPLHASIYPVQDRLGQANGFVLVGRDITDEKRTRAALQQYQADLQRSNRELELFAFVASHDLQEPLRSVASFVQLLGRRYKGKLDADADEFIGFAVDGAERMQALINDLLAYSRVGTHGKPLVPTNAQATFKAALGNLQIAIDESKATITADALPPVKGDPVQLTQLFQNLVGNAIKYRGPAAPRIHVRVQAQDRTWRIAVEDNGIGIDPGQFDRLFVIFQRLHAQDSPYKGTGIGLAICKKIVERHGGRIWCESAPNHGSKFIFTLPRLEETQP